MEEPRTSGRERSPNYPSMGLQAAIEAVLKLWQAEKRTRVPPEVAAKAMGYAGLSGASRSALAALRQYGLIDVVGGAVTASDVTVDLALHAPGSPEYAEAVKAAANSPEIFRELNQTHAEASDPAIKSYLITKRGFSADGAQRLIKAFRETNALANRAAGGYNQAPQVPGSDRGDDMTMPQATTPTQTVSGHHVTIQQYALGGGIRADVRFIGGEPEPSQVRKLGAILIGYAKALEEP